MVEYGRLIFAKSEARARVEAEEDYRKVAAVTPGLSPMRFLDLTCPVYDIPLYGVYGWVAEGPDPKESDGVV